MSYKLFLTQRTNRHVTKRLVSDSAPATYEASFGEWQVSGADVSHLDFPWGITTDASGNIYVCDSVNRRIVKLTSNLTYVSSYSTLSTIGVPHAIVYSGSDIYVVGVYLGTFVRVERITTSLVSVGASGNLNVPTVTDLWDKPIGIVPAFIAGQFLVCGCALDLFVTTETAPGVFSVFVRQTITGQTTTYPNLFRTTQYKGIVKHSINGFLYLNNGRCLLKVDNTFTNVGDSDFISKTTFGLKEGKSGTLLLYNADNQTIMRFDANMNFVENVYTTTGVTVQLDAYDVMDFIEFNI